MFCVMRSGYKASRQTTLCSLYILLHKSFENNLRFKSLKTYYLPPKMLPPINSPNDANTQQPSTLGPDTGIVEVPGRVTYPCINDCETYGGICRSMERVSSPNNKCSNCYVSGFMVYYNLF